MRVWSGLFVLACLSSLPAVARALDDTAPTVRWGLAAGLSGSLPVGDLRASAASRDEFAKALWVDLEPLQFDVGDYFNISPVARFAWLGGVDAKAIEAALDPARRENAMGKKLDDPKVSALELGLKARYFPWGDGRVRPYAALALGYSTLGARYEATAASVSAGPGGAAATSLHVHRHQGLATRLGVGVRYDVPLRVFNTDMRAPIALELAYTHNTWLDLDRSRTIETSGNKLVGESPFVDYVSLSLTVGFLR